MKGVVGCAKCIAEKRAPCVTYVENNIRPGQCKECGHAVAAHDDEEARVYAASSTVVVPSGSTPSRHLKNPSRHGQATRRATAGPRQGNQLFREDEPTAVAPSASTATTATTAALLDRHSGVRQTGMSMTSSAGAAYPSTSSSISVPPIATSAAPSPMRSSDTTAAISPTRGGRRATIDMSKRRGDPQLLPGSVIVTSSQHPAEALRTTDKAIAGGGVVVISASDKTAAGADRRTIGAGERPRSGTGGGGTAPFYPSPTVPAADATRRRSGSGAETVALLPLPQSPPMLPNQQQQQPMSPGRKEVVMGNPPMSSLTKEQLKAQEQQRKEAAIREATLKAEQKERELVKEKEAQRTKEQKERELRESGRALPAVTKPTVQFDKKTTTVAASSKPSPSIPTPPPVPPPGILRTTGPSAAAPASSSSSSSVADKEVSPRSPREPITGSGHVRSLSEGKDVPKEPLSATSDKPKPRKKKSTGTRRKKKDSKSGESLTEASDSPLEIASNYSGGLLRTSGGLLDSKKLPKDKRLNEILQGTREGADHLDRLRSAVAGSDSRMKQLRWWEHMRGISATVLDFNRKDYNLSDVEADLSRYLDEYANVLGSSMQGVPGVGDKAGAGGGGSHKRSRSDGAALTPRRINSNGTTLAVGAPPAGAAPAPAQAPAVHLNNSSVMSSVHPSPNIEPKEKSEKFKGILGALGFKGSKIEHGRGSGGDVAAAAAGGGANVSPFMGAKKDGMQTGGMHKDMQQAQLIQQHQQKKESEQRDREKDKEKRRTMLLSSARASASGKWAGSASFDDEGDKEAFPGVTQHSLVVGPLSNRGKEDAKRAEESGGVGTPSDDVSHSDLREEVLYWKQKYYKSSAETKDWQRQAEEWNLRYLQAVSGMSVVVDDARASGAASGGAGGGSQSDRKHSRPDEMADVYGDSASSLPSAAESNESYWREEARKWKEQAEEWQQRYVEMCSGDVVGGGGAADETGDMGHGEGNSMEEQDMEDEDGMVDMMTSGHLPRSKSAGDLADSQGAVRKKEKKEKKDKKEKDKEAALEKAKKRGSLVVVMNGGPSFCPEQFPPRYAELPLDREVTKSEKSQAGAYRNCYEEYLMGLHQYLKHRKDRRNALENYIQSSRMSEADRQKARREWYTKETALLRRRRVKWRADDFTNIRLIGRGAFGEVWLVKRKDTGDIVALKKIKKAHLIEKNQVESILVEREVLRGTQSDWIVHLYCSFHDSVFLYLAMEYVPGGDFRSLMAQMEFDEQSAQFYAAEMFLAVATLHKWGFSHRDLKPDNFLIARTGHLKLADFGLSKGLLVREEAETATPVKFYLSDGQYTTVMLQRPFTTNKVIQLLLEKLHLEKSSKTFVLVEFNNGYAKRILPPEAQPAMLVLKWTIGTSNRLLLLEQQEANTRVQRDLIMMQQDQQKILGSKKLGTLRRMFGGGESSKPTAVPSAAAGGAGGKGGAAADAKSAAAGAVGAGSGGAAPGGKKGSAPSVPPIAVASVPAAPPPPIVNIEKPVGGAGGGGKDLLRAQVLKNATLLQVAQKEKENAAKEKEKLVIAEGATQDSMKSPRKMSVLTLPSKDLIDDMKKSVYLPRARDFTSMRQERKAVEKAVNEGKEDPSMHFSVVGSPDYMAVEVLRGDGYTSCVDFWAIGCMMYEMIFGFPPFYGESPEEVFMNIMNYDQCLAFPEPGEGPEISPEGIDIIRQLLTEPDRRLGAKTGLKEIKAHPFFKDFPWDTVLTLEPPYVPPLESADDASHFPAHLEAEGNANSTSQPKDEVSPDSPFSAKGAVVARDDSSDDELPQEMAPQASSPRDEFFDSPRDFEEAGLTE